MPWRRLALIAAVALTVSGCAGESAPAPGANSTTPSTDGPRDLPTQDWLARCDAARITANFTLIARRGLESGDVPSVDGRPCNVFRHTNAWLVVPLLGVLPAGTQAIALKRADGIDWLYATPPHFPVMLVRNGTEAAVQVRPPMPAPLFPTGAREIVAFKAAWLGPELHIFVHSLVRYPYPVISPTEETLVHAWWAGSLQEENLPALAPPRLRTYVSLDSDGTNLTFVANEFLLTDIVGQTNEEQVNIWRTASGKFGAPTRRDGVYAWDAAASPAAATHICAAKKGSVFHAQAPEFRFEKIHDNGAFQANCLVAVAGTPSVLHWGFPLIGGNSGGGGGTGGQVNMAVSTLVDGKWALSQVGRGAANVPGFGVSEDGPFIASNRELISMRDGKWGTAWNHTGSALVVLDGSSVPTVYAAPVKTAYWDYRGWAMVALTSG